MKLNYTTQDLLSLVEGATLKGATDTSLESIASLKEAQSGDVAFLANSKYRQDVKTCQASAIFLPLDYDLSEPLDNQAHIFVPDPSFALARLCDAIEAALFPKPTPGIHPSAVVDPSASIDSSAYIGPHCVVEANATISAHVTLISQNYIGPGATIGESSRLHPHATVMGHCLVGKRNILHPHCVIGADGFGYSTAEGVHTKEPQVGNVVLEDDVDVGANAVIDRARFSQTVVGQGTKIDNLVQIAHNVQVGKHCLIVSQTGIAGSTILEDNVTLGGQVGLAGHIRVGQGATVGAQSGANGNIAPGVFVVGTPPHPAELTLRVEVLKKRLPELFKRVDRLESTLVPA